jgi:hypothetical protein
MTPTSTPLWPWNSKHCDENLPVLQWLVSQPFLPIQRIKDTKCTRKSWKIQKNWKEKKIPLIVLTILKQIKWTVRWQNFLGSAFRIYVWLKTAGIILKIQCYTLIFRKSIQSFTEKYTMSQGIPRERQWWFTSQLLLELRSTPEAMHRNHTTL